MIPAPEIHLVTPHFAFWHTYDPASKSELFSTAAADNTRRILVVDPIPLAAEARTSLLGLGTVQAIVVTNANHWRAAAQFSTNFNAPIFGRNGPPPEISIPVEPASRLEELFAGLVMIPIEGAVAGEIALHFPQDGGTLIVGDSLIHFDPYGLSLLPKKYCSSQHEMRRSLRQLLARKSSRIFFAHGLPILNQVMSRLETLLDNE
jgi:glyoxylase-like metal-dependent hydrolase (beta-lactamase superfamily II)